MFVRKLTIWFLVFVTSGLVGLSVPSEVYGGCNSICIQREMKESIERMVRQIKRGEVSTTETKSPRKDVYAATINDYIYVLSHLINNDNSGTTLRVTRFDPSANSWANGVKSEYTCSSCRFGFTELNSKLYIFGGNLGKYNSNYIFTRIIEYDYTQDQFN